MTLRVALLTQEYLDEQRRIDREQDPIKKERPLYIVINLKIDAWRCDECGSVFFDKNQYRFSRERLEEGVANFIEQNEGTADISPEKFPPELLWMITGELPDEETEGA